MAFNYTFYYNSFFYKKSDIDPTIVKNSVTDEILQTKLYFKIYAICYNILRLSNGYTGLAFSAA